MPRLRAAGYKYAALPNVVGEKSAEEIERAELEATWKQKTADMWANAELEVPQAQARRVQQRERKASRAVTVPLPPRTGATSPTRERRKVTTASPSRDGRRVAAKKLLQGQQLEDRTNRGPSSGVDQPVAGAKQLPITAKAWKAKNHAARSTKPTTKAASKKKKKKKKKKKQRVKKKTKAAAKPPTNNELVEPASQLMLHEISVGRLGSGGLGRLKQGSPSPVQEQSGEATEDEDFASSSAESESESSSENSDSDSAAGDASADGARDAGDPEHHGIEAVGGFSDLERQFRSVEASLPAAERAVLADDLRNIAGTISSMSQQQSTAEITKVTGRRADRVRRGENLQAGGGYVANSENDESRQSWSESSDDDRDDDRNHESGPRRDESRWKLHTDVASGEQFEIHSLTQEVRWLGAEASGSDLDARRGTSNTISKGGPRRSSHDRATSKPRRHPAPKQQQQANAERSRARTSRSSRKSSASVRQSSRPSDAKALRRKKVQPRQSAVHDSGEWGGIETAEERQLRMKADRRKEQELRRPVSAESESDSSYDDDDGYSDSDRSQSSAEVDRSQSSSEIEDYESDSVDSTSDKAPQDRSRRSKRGQGQKVPSDRREKSSSRPVEDFDLRKPAGGSRAGRRRGSNDGIFGTTLGGDDEPEALVALEERWQEWWENEPEEPLVGNGSAKDFEKRMADYLHRKRLQETTSAIDVSAPVKPCWHYTQAGDLKKRRQNREKQLEIAQHAARVKASMAKIAGKVPGGGHGVGSRPASKPPRTLRPLDTHAVGSSNRRTGEGTGDERRLLSERVFQHTSKPPPPAPPWYVSKLR